MKKILGLLMVMFSSQILAQATGTTYAELEEAIGVKNDCTQMKQLLETNFGTKYGHNNEKHAKRAFSKWLIQVQTRVDDGRCSDEDYIEMTLRQSEVEKRFVTCLEIHQLTFVLDKNKPEENKLIDEINEATATWYCKPEDFKRLKDKIDVMKK
jgi:hypothetical protein